MIWPKATRPNGNVTAAASVLKDACVLIRRRNSRLRFSSVFVVRNAFHIAFGKSSKVSRSRPASSIDHATAGQDRALRQMLLPEQWLQRRSQLHFEHRLDRFAHLQAQMGFQVLAELQHRGLVVRIVLLSCMASPSDHGDLLS